MGRLTAMTLVLLAACGGPDPCASPSPGLVCPVAGTGELGFNRDGLPPEKTDLYLPSAARRGPDGLVHLMDFNNQRLRRIDEDGLVRTVVGNGFHALANPELPAVDSPLENPIDFAFLPDGRLVFVSYHDPRVILVTEEGGLEVLAGTGEVGMRGDEGDFESPRVAQFIQLDGIAIDDDGAIYVSDSLAHRVRLIRDDIITTVAGTGTAGHSGDGGPATEAELSWPTAMELDPEGNLLIADTRNHAIRQLSTDGALTTIAGTPGMAGFAGDGGPATEALLDQPNGLALAEDGTLYVADRGSFRVRAITPAGIIETVAGTGTEGLSGDGGPALEASFGYIARISLDDEGLLVADQSNGAVRRITSP